MSRRIALACWLLIGVGACMGSATISHAGPVVHHAKRIDVEFQDAELRAVLETLADIGKVNIVVERGVSGRVTARLRNIEWDVALEQIVCSQGLRMTVEGNVIYVRKN